MDKYYTGSKLEHKRMLAATAFNELMVLASLDQAEFI